MEKKNGMNGKPSLRRVVENSGSFYICLPMDFVKRAGIEKGSWMAINYDNDTIQFKKV